MIEHNEIKVISTVVDGVERKTYVIDVGVLCPAKAEEYLNECVRKIKELKERH